MASPGENDAEALKNDGNEAYREKDYRKAERLYTQAIEALPTTDDGALIAEAAPFLGNRGAARVMIGDFAGAEADSVAGRIYVCFVGRNNFGTGVCLPCGF
jgi:tetratricopeptide (TPR) repeat protein